MMAETFNGQSHDDYEEEVCSQYNGEPAYKGCDCCYQDPYPAFRVWVTGTLYSRPWDEDIIGGAPICEYCGHSPHKHKAYQERLKK